MPAIRDSDINALSICGGALLNTSEGCAWPHNRTPYNIAIAEIQCPVDSALLAEAHDLRQQVGARSAQIKIGPAWNRARNGIRVSYTCDC